MGAPMVHNAREALRNARNVLRNQCAAGMPLVRYIAA
jgi:hypothetical protein